MAMKAVQGYKDGWTQMLIVQMRTTSSVGHATGKAQKMPCLVADVRTLLV
eukprot:CAMPEP_0197852618 /NCGR_PEP_ID=MMETSP1438-20131217/21074_1 /TAXON_ID=1461541 /ORGANISM="Pterosperma sp., Strain CCMP1384" /LENGTH=49 /DNA_ID=CAMNT_0043466765 /DNA_START=95 /DNA_END=244 /DNA_ORIENTATION=-